MRAELIPVLLGVLVALVGAAFLADARLPDSPRSGSERRRRVRAERSRRGEAIVGVGVLCMAGALIGRDGWRYGALAVMLGTALVIAGGVMNRRYLREVFAFRGPARRVEEGEAPPTAPADPRRRMRIR